MVDHIYGHAVTRVKEKFLMAFKVSHCICAVLVIVCAGQESAFSQWDWRNPVPQGNSLTDIQTFSPSVCYAAGERGTFLTTKSAGSEWNVNSIEGLPDVSYLQFFDGTTGIILGRQDSLSTLLRTTDGGVHWAEVPLPSGMATSTYFLSKDTGWVATATALLFTPDGGANWLSKKIPDAGVTRLFFVDSLRGWALQSDTIYRTTDGGTSWTGTTPDSMQGWIRTLDKVAFVNPHVGWLIGTSRGPNHYSGHLFKSTDGGAHWAEQLTVGEDFVDYRTFSDVEMRDDQAGWAVSNGRIFKTADGGKKWDQIATVQYLDQISSSSSGQLWGCGANGALYSSSDSGATWTSRFAGTIGMLNDLYWLDQRNGFAAGDTLLLRTRNGGNTWETLPVHLSYQDHFDIHAVWFVDSLRGWMGIERAGGWGSLVMTTDGGQNWQLQLDSVNRIFRLFFVGGDLGWASSGNRVYRTTDQGATWHPGGNSTDPGEIEALFFTSPDSGWAGGYLGLAETTDGGLSWTTVLPEGRAGLFIKDVFFLSSNLGWIVGYSGNRGSIFKTEDGGKSWQSQAHPTTSVFTWPLGVTFVDQNRGWAVGQSPTGGFAFKTSDGGAHWELDDVPFNRPLLRARNEGHHVWLLGANGALLQQSLIGTAVPQLTGENERVHSYRLEQNWPNPFNPKTGVRFSVPPLAGRDLVSTSGRDGQVPGVSQVKLAVYDILGREVAVLVNERKVPGSYQVSFDGSGLASGVYYYRLTMGSFVQTRTMILLR